MGVSKDFFSGALLLTAVMFLDRSASAMEQAKAPAAPSSSAFSMPSFFDGSQLPDLKNAWRAGDGLAASPPAPPNASASGTPPANDDAALAAAKAAMLRAEEAGREAAAVREKAEELSRRFGTDSPPAETSDGPAAAATDTVTGSVEPATTPLPAPSALGAPPPADPADATNPAEATNAGAPKSEPSEGAAPNPGEPATAAVPVLPPKKPGPLTDAATVPASKIATSSSPPRSKTAASNAPAAIPGFRSTPGTAGKADVMPGNIGAFGWDSQPQ